MYKMQITKFLAGLFLALSLAVQNFAQSSGNGLSDESPASKAHAGSLHDREVEARLEQRAEALRTRLFESMVREMDLQARIEDLDFRLTPYGIQRALGFEGSTRPMDELEKTLRARLESQKARMNRLLEYVTANRERLESEIREAEAELERIRQRIDSSIADR